MSSALRRRISIAAWPPPVSGVAVERRYMLSHPTFLSASAMAHAIRRSEISSEEMIRTHLEQILTLNPRLNSVLQIAADTAIVHAQAADAFIERGDDIGPLHGVPFTVKDVFPVGSDAQLVTAPGMADPPDEPAHPESTVVTRLRAAGAIVLGVTRATLWSDREERYGPAHNPYDLSRITSGSSGGEAATIAAGCSALGIGSDSGGSLRMPAHYCGIATLRPSNGRVPRGIDADGTNDPRTAAGPLARSIEDLDLAMRVIAGVDPNDPTTLPLPWPDFRHVNIRGLRVAFFTDNTVVSPTPETATTVAAAAKALSDAGAEITEILPPSMDEAWQITLRYWHYCGAKGEVGEYFEFLKRWDLYRILMAGFMSDYDLILCPVEAGPAGLIGSEETAPGFTYTTPFSLLGWPCAIVRAGTSPEGMPIGVQAVGAPWRDDIALAAAACIEGALGGWQPPIL